MAEAIGIAAAALQFALFVGKTVTVINEYKDAGKGYNKRVDELHSKLQTFESTLQSLSAAADTIESTKRRTQKESNNLLRMRKGLDDSHHTLEALFDCKDEHRRRGKGSKVKVMVHYWLYNNDGGKDDVDRAVNAIADRIETIKTALLSNIVHVAYDSREVLHKIHDRPSSIRASSSGSTASNLSTDSNVSTESYASTVSTAPSSYDDDDTETLCEIITVRVDLDRLIDESETSNLDDNMISAIKKEDYKVVARLLASGGDPLAKDDNGWCAFHYAVRAGSKTVMRHLLSCEKVKGKKGILEQRNTNGVTPLHFASSTGMTAMAKKLLNAGADKNAADYNNRSPLFVAVESNKVDIVELLLDHDAKCMPSTPDRFKKMQNTIRNRKIISGKTKKG